MVLLTTWKILPTDSKEAKTIAAIAKKGYFVLDGILYYESSEVPGKRRLVVPQQLRDRVVSENHDDIFSGHFSAKRMLQKLKQYLTTPHSSTSETPLSYYIVEMQNYHQL